MKFINQSVLLAGAAIRKGSGQFIWSAEGEYEHGSRRLKDISFNCHPIAGEEEYCTLSTVEKNLTLSTSGVTCPSRYGSRNHWTCLLHPDDADGIEGIDLDLDIAVEQYLNEREQDARESKLVLERVDVQKGKIHLKRGRSAMKLEKVHGEWLGRRKMNDGLSREYQKSDKKYNYARRLYNVKTQGTSSVLVLRVKAADAEVSLPGEQLSASVFGGVHNNIEYKVSLKSQMEACSYNKFKLAPAEGPGIMNGVLEVSISEKIRGLSKFTVANYVTAAAEMLLPDLWTTFDHVMYCLPPGTIGRWIGYGYYWWWRTLFNDKWCGYVTNQMHEIGHNLDLRHSGEGTKAYGDQSGVMGYSYSILNGPRLCYNAANSAHLGWYDDRKLVLDPFVQKWWRGKIVGVADYGESVPGHVVVLEIKMLNKTDDHLYLTFNSVKGINDGTKAYQNAVTIVQSREKAPSKALASLVVRRGTSSANCTYAFDVGTDRLTITVAGMGTSGSVDFALVTVSMSCSFDVDCDDGNYCNGVEKCVSGACEAGIAIGESCFPGASSEGSMWPHPKSGTHHAVGNSLQQVLGTTSKPANLLPNVAVGSTVFASSAFSASHVPVNAVDGDFSTQWASWYEGINAWLQIDFASTPVLVTHFGYKSRNGLEFVSRFTLSFSDGSSQQCEMDKAAASELQYFDVSDTVTRSIRFDVDSGGTSAGAIEIQVYGTKEVDAGTGRNLEGRNLRS